VVPDISFFNEDVTKEQYYNFLKNNELFDLKNKTIEYCLNDVKLTLELLVKVLDVMDVKYINLFKKSYSLPSLSYKIFFKY
jgi:transcription elongation factor GreA-like protein